MMDEQQGNETNASNESPSPSLALSEIDSSVGGKQFGRPGGDVGDGVGDNYDHGQDNEVEFHSSGSRRGQVLNRVVLGTGENVNNNDDLRNSSTVESCGGSLDMNRTTKQPGTNRLSAVPQEGLIVLNNPDRQYEQIVKEQQQEDDEEGEEKQAPSQPIERRKVTFIDSDTNNNDLDADVDSSDNSEYNYGNREDEEEDYYTNSSSSDNLDLHISTSTTPPIRHSRRSKNDNTANFCGKRAGIRRRNLGNRTHGREEITDRIDLIKATAVPVKQVNWYEQQRNKKQKLKIMKADGGDRGTGSSSKLAISPGKSHSNFSAYFCRLSRDDFSAASSTLPPPSSKSSQNNHQSDIFKCNNHSSELDDGSIFNKSLSCVKNILKLSQFNQHQEPDSNLPSELKQSNGIKLQNWKVLRDVSDQESDDTNSSVTHEDKSSDMTVISKSGYKTFKGPERRPSRSRGNNSRESQRRLSQMSGYSKLDHHHYQTTIAKERSSVQEYASFIIGFSRVHYVSWHSSVGNNETNPFFLFTLPIFRLKRIALLVVIILISCFLLWQVYELLLGESIVLLIDDNQDCSHPTNQL